MVTGIWKVEIQEGEEDEFKEVYKLFSTGKVVKLSQFFLF